MGFFDRFRSIRRVDSADKNDSYSAKQRANSIIDAGNAIEREGRLTEALQCYCEAMALAPKFARAHLNRGNVLQKLGMLEEALCAFDTAIEYQPDYAAPYYNKGNLLHDLDQFAKAAACYRQALKINPQLAVAHYNLGIALGDLQMFDEAIDSLRKATTIEPGFGAAASHLLFLLTHLETIDSKTLFSEHRRFAEQYESPLQAGWPAHTNDRNPERHLQVGFVSADLRAHAVVSFIEPVLAQLSRYPKLTLHAYYNHPVEDQITQRLRSYFSCWHTISALSDAALAQQIIADRIDILIDLSGHTGGNRLLTFARKPAPVQASWIGHPSTTGLRAVDYYFTDRFYLPKGVFDDQFSEKLVYLPAAAPFLPYDENTPINALPATNNGFLTFGSFNKLSKITPSVVALWAKLLRAIPKARLIQGGMPRQTDFNPLKSLFAKEGIADERLDFFPRSDISSYLALYHHVDICLDTFPFSGCTVSNHALWMGVPTLTLPGDTAASRQGATILAHVGLESFVADNAENFVKKGLWWSDNLHLLAEVRAGLRERIAQSPTRQPEIIVTGFERALRMMWRKWCAGLPPESFDVTEMKQTMKPQGMDE